jgi:hypothetical protein
MKANADATKLQAEQLKAGTEVNAERLKMRSSFWDWPLAWWALWPSM